MRNWQAKIRPHWTHWLQIVLAVAVVVVAAVVSAAQISIYKQQAKIMGIQAEIAQKQADIMNTQTDIAQRQLAQMQSEGRAWIGPSRTSSTALEKDKPLKIAVEYRNSGRLPASFIFSNQSIALQTTNGMTEVHLIK
jgi:hypothetical protein